MIYSAMPSALIFADWSQTTATLVLYVGDCLLEVAGQDGQWYIVRNLSTNPSHHLDMRYQPGHLL